MCGIWGFSTCDMTIKASEIESIAKKLLILSETRGKDAAGVAVMTPKQLNVYKRAQTAQEMVKTESYKDFMSRNLSLAPFSEGVALMGHSRMVTNGTQYWADNNQPVCKKKMVAVHNGIIVNSDELWTEHPELERISDVDTEVFVELCEENRKTANTKESICKTYAQIHGMASTLNMFADQGVMVAASNNGSLYQCVSKNGKSVLFASEQLILKALLQTVEVAKRNFSVENIEQVLAGQALLLDPRTGKVDGFSLSGEKADKEEPFLVENRELTIDREKSKEDCRQAPEHFDASKYTEFDISLDPIRKLKRCTRCVLPETMPFIQFDEDGVCNYCQTYKKQEYLGEDALKLWADRQRRSDGRADSIVSFSGGRDSSYGLHYFVKELGLHPVTFSYDWGMVTDLARRNQSRLCADLGVELILVSADLKKKRDNIRKNVSAWLKKPDLGMVPLFMAGDKQYFYYANKVREAYGLDTVLMASNPFEKTHFKSGFCGVMPSILKQKGDGMELEQLAAGSILRMAGHYAKQYITNPGYINGSLWDTATATASYYMIPHNYFRLFNYIPWEEKKVNDVLLNQYGWEISSDADSTWRIGDGTSPFYNYIYYLVGGFTENDTLRSNQIREGMLTRKEALELVYRDNVPRYESMQWYFDTIGLDMREALKIVQKIPRLYNEIG